MSKPTLSDGNTTVTLNVPETISESEDVRMVKHSPPERSGDVYQFMGRGSKTIPISGETSNQSDKDQLRSWARNGTELVYNDDENTDLDVVMLSFSYDREPGLHGYYFYSFNLAEFE